MDDDGETRYYVNGVATYAGLIRWGDYYYYINSSLKAVKNCTYWVSKTNNTAIPSGNYDFDAQGRMINAPDAWIDVDVAYTYNSDGLRTGKTVTTSYDLSDEETVRSYSYTYNGSQLTGLTVNCTAADGTVTTHTMRIGYDSNGPMYIKFDDATYQYVTNLQGDVIALLNSAGAVVVEYTYDAWGNIFSMTGSLASTLGEYNPLRYRGYVYDTETGLYYLQSRYYKPKLGRFINADAFASTGQGILGNNMFAYCNNNPVNYADPCGTCCHRLDFWNDCENCVDKTEEEKWQEYYDMLNESLTMQAESQQQVDELSFQASRDAAAAMWDAYVQSNELQAQAQYDRDMQIRAQWEDAFRSPVRTGNFVTMTIGNVSAYTAYYAAASATSLSFLGALGVGIAVGCAIWTTLCYYEIIGE